MKTFIALVMLTAAVGCTAPAAKNECSWVKMVFVGPADIITQSTANKIIAHNLKVACFCRGDDRACEAAGYGIVVEDGRYS